MIGSIWPLFRLRLTTAALELRLPAPDDLAELAALAAAGIHDPDVQPFTVAWTDAPPEERARSTVQYHWRCWGTWQPVDWTLNLVALRGGQVVGTQALAARDFGTLREVSTGSWVGRAFQRQGIGTHMRAAVLELAFAGLSAEHAVSGAYAGNAASHAVSRRIGYTDDGIERHAVRNAPQVLRRLRLDRAGWAAHRTIPVRVEGLAPCLPLFGLTAPSDTDRPADPPTG